MVGAFGVLVAAASLGSTAEARSTRGLSGIHKIRHIVVIMQENRSFDSYFGTFPRADGIPGLAGHPGKVPCVPDPMRHNCQKPYHNHGDSNAGGPHMAVDAVADIHRGKMDGFIASVESGHPDTDRLACRAPITTNSELVQVLNGPPTCLDVMGYHDAREIPDYWKYAKNYVLQDHMFEPTASWSLPAHLYMMSGWSATCLSVMDPMSCTTNLIQPDADGVPPTANQSGAALLGLLTVSDQDDTTSPAQPPDYGWTDITYMLYKHRVSWRYYLGQGTEPDCASGAMTCTPVPQSVNSPEIWNPLPDFVDVHQDNQLGNIVPDTEFFRDAYRGHLPARYRG